MHVRFDGMEKGCFSDENEHNHNIETGSSVSCRASQRKRISSGTLATNGRKWPVGFGSSLGRSCHGSWSAWFKEIHT